MLAFAPDAPITTAELLVDVSAVPTARGYASPPVGVSDGSSAVPASTLGGALLLKLDASNVTLAATASNIYSLSGGSWSSVGSGYSVGTNRWCFAIFGNTMLAANKAAYLQSGTSSFSTVSNSPKAACMDVGDLFVCLGNCDDTGSLGLYGDQPHRWWISQRTNPTGTWAPSLSTRATTGLLVDTPGPITCVRRLGRYMIYYKSKGIYVGQFVGPPTELDFVCVSTDVGCAARDAVVAAGSVHYFPGDDDFYAFDGTRPSPIGAPIKEWFFGRVSRSNMSLMQALHDRINSLIYWFYPVGNSASLTACIVYHYQTNRWGAFDLTVTDVLQAVTNGITIDTLGALYATFNDLPDIPFDSQYWTAATPVLAYIDTSSYLKSLSGSGGPMSCTTGMIGDEMSVSFCSNVLPKFRERPSAGTIVGSTVMELGDTPTQASSSTLNGRRFNVAQSGLYHQFAMEFTDQTELEAISLQLQPDGEE